MTVCTVIDTQLVFIISYFKLDTRHWTYDFLLSPNKHLSGILRHICGVGLANRSNSRDIYFSGRKVRFLRGVGNSTGWLVRKRGCKVTSRRFGGPRRDRVRTLESCELERNVYGGRYTCSIAAPNGPS